MANPEHNIPGQLWSSNSRYFWLLLLPGSVLILLAGTLLYLYLAQRLDTSLGQANAVTLSAASSRIQSRIDQISDDLMLLAGEDRLRAYVQSPSTDNGAMLEAHWKHFMQSKQIFDQVRLLHINGTERIRIDLNAGLAERLPESQLQDKSSRYYIKAAISLQAGEIFLSRLDLNVEHDRGEQPVKPTLRFITPIDSTAGIRRGYLVLNYLADDLLDPLRNKDTTPLWLTDADGHWLIGPSNSLEWGFMSSDQDNRLATDYPAAWQAIQPLNHGQFRNAAGLWNVQRVDPLKQSPQVDRLSPYRFQTDSAYIGHTGYPWYLIQLVPAAVLHQQLADKRALIMLSVSALLFTWLLVCWRLSWAQQALNAQRRATRAAQLETETFLEQSPDPMLAVDANGRIRRYNQAVIRYFGYSPAQLNKMPVDQLLPERFRHHHKQLRSRFTQQPKQRKMGHGEFLSALTADGEERPVSINLSHFASQSGEPLFTATLHDVSQEIMFQQELLRFKERLSLATSAAELGIWDWNMAQDRLYWDEGMHRIYGTEPDQFQVSYAAWLKSVHPEDKAGAVSALETALDQDSHQDFFSEFRITCPDGKVKYIRAHGRVIHDDKGQAKRIIGTNQDISEQKQAEQALTKHAEQLRQAQRLGQIGHWSLDLQTYQFNWSDEMFQLFEMDTAGSQPSYEAFMNRVHPADREDISKAYNDALKNRTPYVLQHRLLFPDGRIKWVEERCQTEYSAQGEALFSQGTVQDITQQKRAEERLQIAASVFTHAREAIFISDPDNHIITANHAFEEITGYNLAEVVGCDPKILGSQSPEDQTYQSMWEHLRRQDHWSGEIHNRRKNGERYLAELTISCVRNSSDEVLRYVALLSDITQQRQQRQQLEYMAHHDPLTGLVNRVMFLGHLQQEMANCRRQGNELALAFVDLDGFKPINDRYGHQAGDRILQITAQRIRHACRESDIVGRWGGDEFVILITSLTDRTDSQHLIQRLLNEMQQAFILGEDNLNLSCSIGLAFYDNPQLTADQLINRSDQAMYQAKAAGKNRCCLFDDQAT